MKRFVILAVPWVLLAAGTAYYFTAQGPGARGQKDRPIVIVLSQKKNSDECEAKFGKKPQHAFRSDTISWEFINNCNADQTVTLATKTSSNPFTTNSPWTVVAKAGAANPDEIKLTVASNAAYDEYGFDIKIGTKTYDPRLVIDP